MPVGTHVGGGFALTSSEYLYTSAAATCLILELATSMVC